MSRAFVKEDDARQLPIIPPRAALPPGIPNYVTPQGLALLRAELVNLEQERARTEANHTDQEERTRQLTIINGRLSALNERLASAKLVHLHQQPANEVRFGATVTLRTVSGVQAGKVQRFTIVGVDEASVAEGRVAFVAPIARAVVGLVLGQTASIHTGAGEEVIEVVSIT